MKIVNVHDAETALSQWLAEVERGEEVVIARDGKPVARLCLYVAPSGRREPGLWQNHPGWKNFVFDPHVLAPMTEQEMAEEGW